MLVSRPSPRKTPKFPARSRCRCVTPAARRRCGAVGGFEPRESAGGGGGSRSRRPPGGWAARPAECPGCPRLSLDGVPHGSALLFSHLGAGVSGRLPGNPGKLCVFAVWPEHCIGWSSWRTSGQYPNFKKLDRGQTVPWWSLNTSCTIVNELKKKKNRAFDGSAK